MASSPLGAPSPAGGGARSPTRRRAPEAPGADPDYKLITTTSRAFYGGPAGADASAWTAETMHDRFLDDRLRALAAHARRADAAARAGERTGVRAVLPGVGDPRPAAGVTTPGGGGGGGGGRAGSFTGGFAPPPFGTDADVPRPPPAAFAEAQGQAARAFGAGYSAAAAAAAGVGGAAPLTPHRLDLDGGAPQPMDGDDDGGSDDCGDGEAPAPGGGGAPAGGAPDTAPSYGAASSTAARAAAEAPTLLSAIVSGRPAEQASAAERLDDLLRRHGAPVAAAVRSAGGVQSLLVALETTRDRHLRSSCASSLAGAGEACAPALAEMAGGPGGPSRVVALVLPALASRQDPAPARLLGVLAGAPTEGVKAAFAEHKVAKRLTDVVAAPDAAPAARSAALAALDVYCRADPAQAKKVAWGGGLEALARILRAGGGSDDAYAALRLALLIAGSQPAAALGSLATPGAVRALAAFVGPPGLPAEAQAAAARLLALVAALPGKTGATVGALVDHALPRCCEVLRGAAAAAAGGAPAADAHAVALLHGAAAAVVAHVCAESRLACAAVVRHTEALKPALAVLVASRQFVAAQTLLRAAAEFAADPDGSAAAAAAAGV